jgi:hypothetical protein
MEIPFDHASAANYLVNICEILAVNMNLKPEDLDILALLKYNFKQNLVSLLPVSDPSQVSVGRSSLALLKVHESDFLLNFSTDAAADADGRLLELKFMELDAKMLVGRCKKKQLSIELQSTRIHNYHKVDQFPMDDKENLPFLRVSIALTKPMIKIPIYEKIEIQIGPVLMIPYDHSNSLVEHLKLFRLPPEFLASVEAAASPGAHGGASENDEAHNEYHHGQTAVQQVDAFCQEFRVYKIKAQVRLRRNFGILKVTPTETLNHPGLQLRDIYEPKSSWWSAIKHLGWELFWTGILTS